jgi:hypothetical protein
MVDLLVVEDETALLADRSVGVRRYEALTLRTGSLVSQRYVLVERLLVDVSGAFIRSHEARNHVPSPVRGK